VTNIFWKKKVSVSEFSEVLSAFILKEVKLLIDDAEKLDSIGVNKESVIKNYISIIIIHTYATCKAFELIDISVGNRNQIFDNFHEIILSKLTDSKEEYDRLYSFVLRLYDDFNDIPNTKDSKYLMVLGGKFYRTLSDDEPDAITVFNLNKLYINFMLIVKDAYPKYRIKFK
jgi:hypothetical protein